MLRIDEVVGFFNHKYGEKAYYIEEEKLLRIFTRDSKWIIFKDINCGSRNYELLHSSSSNNHKHYHIQMKSEWLDYLVWRACIHDYCNNNIQEIPCHTWQDFKTSYEYFQYGRQLAESVALFDWGV